MSSLRPGNDGEPLPHGTLVFRVAKNAWLSPAALEERKAAEIMFNLSTDEKKSEIPRLSIWVEELTVADQAWDFMGKNPEYTIVACLNVDDIRSIVPPEGFIPLQAEWERAMTEDRDGNLIPNTRPGAEGHAGISNLYQGGENKTHKKLLKALRSRLADRAKVSPVPVPHDLPETVVTAIAQFEWRREGQPDGRAEVHWIRAVQRLRRTRVRGFYRGSIAFSTEQAG